MTWLIFAMGGYFINAINAVVDKFLLGEKDAGALSEGKRGKIPEPLTYSFYVGLLSIFALMFAPFGLQWPGLAQFFLSLIVGAVFLGALMAYFVAIKKSEASRVVPIIGGFTPIFIFTLSYFLLGERLDIFELFAFASLVAGAILISIKRSDNHDLPRRKYSIEAFEISLLAALFFALFYVGMKFVFVHQDFVSGFIWTRMGSFLLALMLLLPKENREIIFPATKEIEFKTGSLFVFNKALGGLAFLLNNYAISLGSVILVNAMQGVQYVFLFGMTLFFSSRAPWVLEEKTTSLVVLQKSMAILLISMGLIVLVVF